MVVQTSAVLEAAVADEALLAEFARMGAQEPFRAIVDRHAAWVYGAAFRQLRDRQAAEDAAQAVFVLLCQRARQMKPPHKIAGWLFRTLQYTVRGLLRAERRRQFHERRVAMRRAEATEDKAPLENELDAAVARLGSADQMAIVSRFYEGLEFAAVAEMRTVRLLFVEQGK